MAYSGYELKVKAALEERIALAGLKDQFGEILVPTESVVELKSGAKKKTERKFFPGYILIEMEMNDDTWQLVNLNPHLLYISNYKELGSEDAYSRVLDGEHRDTVKQAFNAMVQASGPLKQCPDDIDLSEIEMSWPELRDRIVAAHKPIADQFFIGIGNKLQYKDSCIAERVMLQFVSMDAPALPVHDSFIVHHAYAESGEIEEIMRRAFYDEMGEHISKVDTEILSWEYRKDVEPDSIETAPNVDQILTSDDDVSQWRQRHQLWYESRI